MPTVTYNLILHGLSGKPGNVVVRQLNGNTIIQAAPVRKAPATKGELTNREKFKQPVAYAKNARQNPALWEMYTAEAKRRGGNSNAWAVAVSDYRKGLKLRKEKLSRLAVRKQPAFSIKTAAVALRKSPGNEMRRVYRLAKINRLPKYRFSYSTSCLNNPVTGQPGFNTS